MSIAADEQEQASRPTGGPSARQPVPPASEPTQALELERAWVQRARRGDVAAFEAIFRRYYQRLCDFAERYVPSGDQAEDVVVEVFTRAWQQRAVCRGCDSVRAYLYVAVRNQGLKLARHRRVAARLADRVAAGEPVPALGGPGGTPEEWAAAGELQRAANLAIAALPERSRQAYLLHRQHGLSYAEIAETMGLTVKTVENHLARAVRALREALAPWAP